MKPKVASTASLLTTDSVLTALRLSVARLTPTYQMRNPVMFVVYVGSIVTTVLFFQNLAHKTGEPVWFIGWTAIWLWLTVLFANFAESIAESRGKAQAETL